MKISLFSIPDIKLGKQNIKDSRLDEVDKFVNAKKKTYIQVELVGEESLLEADAVLTLEGSRPDLILKDLEFVETRLSRSEDETEKALLNKFKERLEKEEFLSSISLTPQEESLISSYGLITRKPVIIAAAADLENSDQLLFRAVKEAGYISFFTAGEKDTRAWMIKSGLNAKQAAGEIHSDIERGFIRAEIISFNDFIQAGGEAKAKQAGKMRPEQKDYIMQDADLVNFKFNK